MTEWDKRAMNIFAEFSGRNANDILESHTLEELGLTRHLIRPQVMIRMVKDFPVEIDIFKHGATVGKSLERIRYAIESATAA